MRNIAISLFGILLGLALGYALIPLHTAAKIQDQAHEVIPIIPDRPMVLGFLPYWLLDKADKNYAQYINTLAYFSLTVDADGSIQKTTNPGEAEPGWHTLDAGLVDEVLAKTKKDTMTLSLVVFSGNNENIYNLMDEPEEHAQTMMNEVMPVMKEYGFTDLNIDIESVTEASPEAQLRFTRFMKIVRSELDKNKGLTLSIDVSPIALFRSYLVNAEQVAPLVDRFILMGYDYHYPGSSVTGPVAPQSGAGNISEIDTHVGVQKSLEIMPAQKIVLAIPVYGYEWESLDTFNRAATIPSSGLAASNRRVEEFLADCTNCIVKREDAAAESYVVYLDPETDTYHQIFYPDTAATQVKVDYAKKMKLGGIGIWALGYEGETILEPLKSYK